MNGYFTNMMFNPQFVNPTYYHAQMQQAQYAFQQDKKVCDAVKAIRDLCEAIQGMDEPHQQQTFAACLAEMARQFRW